MFSYAIRRLLGAIPTLFIIVTITFFMMRIAPGGPFDSQRRLPPEIEHNIKAAYNLDKPVYQQYVIYLGKLVRGNMGPSYKNKDFTVNELIADGLPVSAEIGLASMVMALLVGMILGTFAALWQNSILDYGVMSVAMMGITIPTFVLGPILTLIFGVYGLTLFGYDISLPVGGWNGGAWRNLVLPIFVLGVPQIAYVARIMRGSMVEVLHSNYVRTARAKGLSSFMIVIRHALRAAVLPLVSYLGPAIAGVLTGSLVVEQLFGIPGIGRYFVQGALNRDYTLVMGVLVYYATAIIILNLVADLLYAVLDPRVRYAK
jgi:oligopeptide transport system permease protein